MCLDGLFGGGDKPALPPQRDYEAERRATDEAAAKTANEATANRKRQQRANSLLSTGAPSSDGTGSGSTVLAQGKRTLGA